MKKYCEECNKEYKITRPCRFKTSRFCSKKCQLKNISKNKIGTHLSQETKEKISKAHKGRIHSIQSRKNMSDAHKGKTHSLETRKKMSKSRIGEKHHNWKGGKTTDKRGYIYKRSINHPFKNRHGYVFEHRLVMEKRLNRFLTKKEVVHHINGVVDDNRIENLMLFANNVEHLAWHSKHDPNYRNK